MNIVIIGAGAMGGLFAARLALHGAKVSLIDASQPTIDAISANGLCLRLDHGERRVSVPISRAEQASGAADLLIVFTKGVHTAAAIDSVRHLVGPATWALTLQNGLGNAECIAEVIDPQRLLIGMTTLPADLEGPGVVHAIESGEIRLWGYRGQESVRLREVAQLLNDAGLTSILEPAVESAIWEKVAFNAALNALCTVSGQAVGTVGASADGRWLAEQVVEETARVANALGIAFCAEHVRAAMAAVYVEQAGHKPSMLQDRLAGRPTEIESINGAILRFAQQTGVATPTVETLYRLVRLCCAA